MSIDISITVEIECDKCNHWESYDASEPLSESTIYDCAES